MEDTNQQEDYNPYTDKLESQVQKLQKERDELTSENERLRDALKQAMPYARDQFCPIELQERVNALLSPKSDKP